MPDTLNIAANATAGSAVDLIVDELADALRGVSSSDLEAAEDLIERAPRIFVLGQGRSGIGLRSFAMRLMHLGVVTHVVGDTTSPSVQSGDVLVVASGSGSTESVVRSATKAAALDARIIALTSSPESPLAQLAEVVVVVRAAVKTDHGSSMSAQYAGSLFEQSVSLLGDALFHSLWQRSGSPAEDLWTRHANLE